MIALLVSCNTTPDPLPSGGGETTTGDATEAASGDVTTAGSEGYASSSTSPWYLSVPPRDFNTVSVPDALDGQVMQVPTLTEETVGDVHYKIELFRETWDIGDWVQCRLTFTNQGDESLTYWENCSLCFDFRYGEKSSHSNTSFLTSSFFDHDDVYMQRLAPEESFVLEMVSFVDPEIFLSGDPVTIVVRLYTGDGLETYGSVTIPVTLTEIPQ